MAKLDAHRGFVNELCNTVKCNIHHHPEKKHSNAPPAPLQQNKKKKPPPEWNEN